MAEDAPSDASPGRRTSPFAEWNQAFEGAACVAAMVDSLCHRVEIVQMEGESHRAIEADKQRAKLRRNKRRKAKK